MANFYKHDFDNWTELSELKDVSNSFEQKNIKIYKVTDDECL